MTAPRDVTDEDRRRCAVRRKVEDIEERRRLAAELRDWNDGENRII